MKICKDLIIFAAMVAAINFSAIDLAFAVDEVCEAGCNESFEECNNGSLDGDCLGKQSDCLAKCG